mmetsp:Transcript_36034/g.90728  ORF Transcript_36034/g.90728 Transcript_36034/m.90728 type:complete len:253 (+) Transcript_36034:366-1124(+)
MALKQQQDAFKQQQDAFAQKLCQQQDSFTQELRKLYSSLDARNSPQHRDEPSDNTPSKDQESEADVLEIFKMSMEVQTIDTNATAVVPETSTTSTEVQTINTNDTETGGPALTTTREPSGDPAAATTTCTKALHKQVKHLSTTVQKLQASQEQDKKKIDALQEVDKGLQEQITHYEERISQADASADQLQNNVLQLRTEHKTRMAASNSAVDRLGSRWKSCRRRRRVKSQRYSGLVVSLKPNASNLRKQMST